MSARIDQLVEELVVELTSGTIQVNPCDLDRDILRVYLTTAFTSGIVYAHSRRLRLLRTS